MRTRVTGATGAGRGSTRSALERLRDSATLLARAGEGHGERPREAEADGVAIRLGAEGREAVDVSPIGKSEKLDVLMEL
jgi:hypothetical protein